MRVYGVRRRRAAAIWAGAAAATGWPGTAAIRSPGARPARGPQWDGRGGAGGNAADGRDAAAGMPPHVKDPFAGHDGMGGDGKSAMDLNSLATGGDDSVFGEMSHMQVGESPY